MKNLGTSLENLGMSLEAKAAYEEAVLTDPDHADSHFALAQFHVRFDSNWILALDQLDLAIQKKRYSAVKNRHITGLRVECLFQIDKAQEAFRLVWELVTSEKTSGWEWGWCARLVAKHGLKNKESAGQALRFWRRFLELHRNDKHAVDEHFRCLLFLGAGNETMPLPFVELKNLGRTVIENGTSEAAWVWDRLGHWAQDLGDWVEAGAAFSNAAEADPDSYSYCHAVALNGLEEYEAALSVLLLEANRRPDDEMVWFQVGYACEHLGDHKGAVRAYKKAIELDPTYSAALFNLGGVNWNAGYRKEAVAIWEEAIERFPSHELAERLRRELPEFFGSRSNNG